MKDLHRVIQEMTKMVFTSPDGTSLGILTVNLLFPSILLKLNGFNVGPHSAIYDTKY